MPTSKRALSILSSVNLSIPELNALSLFVENLRPESVSVLEAMPSEYINGAQTYVQSACTSCHKVNGVGGGVGPALNGLSDRHTEQWIRDHFASPQRLSPGSIMPPYQFPKSTEDALMMYLLSLPQ